MKKLVFINPVSKFRKGFLRTKTTKYVPLVYGILAALTPDNWDIEIIDENYDDFRFKEADLVGITAYTGSAYRAYKIAAEYRKKKIPVVMGGIHASMLPDEAGRYVDSVVVGEAESVWPGLLADFDNNRLKKLYTGRRLPLDRIPIARHDLFHENYTMGSVLTTRGCPFNCDFCTVSAFNGNKYRMRPVEHVLDELERIKQDKLFFIDDNIIGYSKSSKEHAKAIFKGMIDRGIKKSWWSQASLNFADDEELLQLAAESGCRLIFMGIESEKADALQSINKRLNKKIGSDKYKEAFDKIHKAGIAVLGSFIFGLETDTREDIIRRREYVLNSDIDAYQLGILTPMPGTKTFEKYTSEGRIFKNNYPEDWKYYSVEDVTFEPGSITSENLYEEMKTTWEILYGKKVVTKKFIKTLRLTGNLESAMWALSTNISYSNMRSDLFGTEPFKIEDIIGKPV